MRFNSKSQSARLFMMGVVIAFSTTLLIGAQKEAPSEIAKRMTELESKYIKDKDKNGSPITKELTELQSKEKDINDRINSGELSGEKAKEARAALILEASKAAEKLVHEVAKSGKVAATQLRGELARGGMRLSVFGGSEAEKKASAEKSADILAQIMEPIERIGKNDATAEEMESIRNRMRITADRAVAVGMSAEAIKKLIENRTAFVKNAAEQDASNAKGSSEAGEAPSSEGGNALAHLGSESGGKGRPKATGAKGETAVSAAMKILKQSGLSPEGLSEGSEIITDKQFMKSSEVVAGISKMGKILETAEAKSGDNDKAMEEVYKWLEKIGLSEKERALLCKTKANPNPKCNTYMCKQPGA